jgi:hypothetical protein
MINELTFWPHEHLQLVMTPSFHPISGDYSFYKHETLTSRPKRT